MKRDPRLRSLSSDHHRALVMARKMSKASEAGDDIQADILDKIRVFCHEELKPHFVLEESILLPALRRHGENDIVEQTLSEHAQMMQLVARLDQADVLRQLAQLLKQHVRFEEQQLFEVSQEKLTDAELEAIASGS